MGRLEGKVALITGAASGIGAATARLFAQEGARVAIADIRGAAAETTAAKIRDDGGQAIAIETDVTDPAQVQAMVATTLSTYGALHILHSNAGVLIAGSVHDMPQELWDKSIAVNLTGSFLCAKHAIPALQRSGGGSIIITSSSSGLQGEKVSAAYNATKGGLINFTRQLAVDYAKDNIRVNALCPGWIDTPFNDPIYEGAGFTKESTYKAIPLGRQGTPEEAAYAVLFLASDESSYITGHILLVDGGLTAQAAHDVVL
jgi:meso-butanediol dehydrogenase / (S,S)-butanediol dehydrogenase / diacetyl reductase